LRRLRLERGLSQRALAGDVVTPSYVSIVEAGGRVPTLDVVLHMARQLPATIEELLGEDGNLLWAQTAVRSGAGATMLAAQQSAQEYLDIGDYAAASRTLLASFERCVAFGESDAALQFGLRLQSVLTALGDRAARLELVERMLELPVPAEAERVSLALRIDHAAALRDLGRLTEARDVAQSALADAGEDEARAGSPEHVRCLGVLISALSELGEPAVAQPLIPVMLALAERSGSRILSGRARWVAALAHAQAGRAEEAAEQIIAAVGRLSSPGLPLAEWARLCRSVTAILLDGAAPGEERRRETEEWLRDAERTARLLNGPADVAAAACLRARFELGLGHARDAARIFAGVLRPDNPLQGLERIRAELSYADALERSGATQEAAQALREAAEMLERSGALQRAIQVWRRIDQLRDPNGEPAKA